MRWRVEYTRAALKQLKKMGKSDSKRVLDWMDKNIDGCLNPHAHGKSLTGNRSGEWRYRVGKIRVLAYIHDDVVTVEVFSVGYRREVYDGR